MNSDVKSHLLSIDVYVPDWECMDRIQNISTEQENSELPVGFRTALWK